MKARRSLQLRTAVTATVSSRGAMGGAILERRPAVAAARAARAVARRTVVIESDRFRYSPPQSRDRGRARSTADGGGGRVSLEVVTLRCEHREDVPCVDHPHPR